MRVELVDLYCEGITRVLLVCDRSDGDTAVGRGVGSRVCVFVGLGLRLDDRSGLCLQYNTLCRITEKRRL